MSFRRNFSGVTIIWLSNKATSHRYRFLSLEPDSLLWKRDVAAASPKNSVTFLVFLDRERGNSGEPRRSWLSLRGGLNPLRAIHEANSWNMDLESYLKKLYERSRRPPAASSSAMIIDVTMRRDSPRLSTCYPMSCRGKKSFPGAGGFTEISALADACSRMYHRPEKMMIILHGISAR